MKLSLVRNITVLFVISAVGAVAGEVSGPFAKSVSAADIAQIKAAVSKSTRISHNVKKLEAIRPDKVAVQTRVRSAVDEDTLYDFMVEKRKGTWAINESSIQITTEQRDLRTNGPTFIR